MHSHLSYFMYIAAMLYAQKMKSSLMKTSSRRVGPRSSACDMVLVSVV
jgi:hypothetical protein